MKFKVYLLIVEVAGKEKKDGSEKHRKNIREQEIGFRRIDYLRKE